MSVPILIKWKRSDMSTWPWETLHSDSVPGICIYRPSLLRSYISNYANANVAAVSRRHSNCEHLINMHWIGLSPGTDTGWMHSQWPGLGTMPRSLCSRLSGASQASGFWAFRLSAFRPSGKKTTGQLSRIIAFHCPGSHTGTRPDKCTRLQR